MDLHGVSCVPVFFLWKIRQPYTLLGWRKLYESEQSDRLTSEEGQMAAPRCLPLFYLWAGATLLLDLSLRIHDLFRLHGGEFLGNDLQRHHVDLPGLRCHTRVRQ